MVSAVDPIPIKEIEEKQPKDMIMVCGREREIAKISDGFVELNGINPESNYYNVDFADWLVRKEYRYVPMMVNDTYISKFVYLDSIYFSKDCKMYGVEIFGETPK